MNGEHSLHLFSTNRPMRDTQMLKYTQPDLEKKVIGGCWHAERRDMRLSVVNRISGLPARGDTGTGFRLCRYLTVLAQLIPSEEP